MKLNQTLIVNSTRDYIYQLLKTDILGLKLEPGRNLSEKEISERYEVSRTPVREAFLKLSQEGLLEIYPQKGTFVSLIDLTIVEEARFMREQLEKAVVRLACDNYSKEYLFELETNLRMQELCTEEKNYNKLFDLDEQFHGSIFEGCSKKRIWLTIQQMNSDFSRIRMLRLSTNYDWEDILSTHQEIVQSIKTNNADQAENVMKKHLTLIQLDKEQLLQKYNSYFK
jgi:GntR family transcriptional regulator, rspAB operon transcriptional repressor